MKLRGPCGTMRDNSYPQKLRLCGFEWCSSQPCNQHQRRYIEILRLRQRFCVQKNRPILGQCLAVAVDVIGCELVGFSKYYVGDFART